MEPGGQPIDPLLPFLRWLITNHPWLSNYVDRLATIHIGEPFPPSSNINKQIAGFQKVQFLYKMLFSLRIRQTMDLPCDAAVKNVHESRDSCS
jgi:hypothetical protein